MPRPEMPARRSSRPKLPAISRGQVSFNGTTIDYEIRRSPRRKKTVEIRLAPEGLFVSAPSRTPDDYIRNFVLSRAPWIIKKQSEPRLEPQPRLFITGETLPYLGRDIELIVEDGMTSSTQVSLHQGKFRVSVGPILGDDERRDSIRKAFAVWYRARSQDYIPPLVEEWWSRMGLSKDYQVKVRTQRTLWGSCAPDGTLRFSWRNMMLSPDIIEYVVVHELAHLSVKNHSPRFWDVVARALPDAKQRRKLLRETGSALPL